MKKQNIPILVATACMTWLTVACTDRETPEKEHADRTLLEMDFSMGHAEENHRTPRSIIEGISITAPIGIYLAKNSDNTAYPGGTGNGKYTCTYGGGKWSGNEAIYLYHETAKIHAFHPAGLTVTNSTDGVHTVPVSIPATQTFVGTTATETNVNDYLYGLDGNTTASSLATANNQGDGSPVTRSIYMHHAMSRVIFRVQYAQSRMPDATHDYVKSVQLASGAYHSGNGKMQLTDGKLTGLSAGTPLVFKANSTTEILPGATGSPAIVAYGLVAPCARPGDTPVFSLTIGARGDASADQTFSVGSTKFQMAWEAGKTYIYSLILDNVDIRIESASTINGWSTQNNSGEIKPDGYSLNIKAEISGGNRSRAAASGSAVYDRDRFYDNDRILITQTKSGVSKQTGYLYSTAGGWSAENAADKLYAQAASTYQGQYPVVYNGILSNQSTADYFRQSNRLLTPTITPDDQWLDFTGSNAFTHANSRVTLKFVWKQTPTSTSIRISGKGLHSGTAGNTENISFYHAESHTYTGIVYPGISGDLSLTVSADGVNYPVTLSCARAANTHYIYTLTLKNDILVTLAAEIKEWNNGGSIDGTLTE